MDDAVATSVPFITPENIMRAFYDFIQEKYREHFHKTIRIKTETDRSAADDEVLLIRPLEISEPAFRWLRRQAAFYSSFLTGVLVFGNPALKT